MYWRRLGCLGGVGGLVRAYGSAAGEALDLATTEPWVARMLAHIVHEHRDTDAVVRAMATVHATDIEVTYEAVVTRKIEVAVDLTEVLLIAIGDATSGRASVTFE